MDTGTSSVSGYSEAWDGTNVLISMTVTGTTSGFFENDDPQNSTPRSSNPNCMRNAVVDRNGNPVSPGLGRPFDANPGPDGRVFHDGPHALSPPGQSAYAATLAPLAGTIVGEGI